MAVAQSEDETTQGSEPQPERGGANASAASRLAAKRAAKAAAKAAKKGTAPVGVPDDVQERVATAAAAYERNSSKLWLSLGAAVVLGAGVFALLDVYGARDHEAAAALDQGIEAARGAIVKEGEDAPEDDDIETFTSQEGQRGLRERCAKARGQAVGALGEAR